MWTLTVDLRLRLPGLLLIILCTVILIVGGSKFSRYIAVEGGKTGLSASPSPFDGNPITVRGVTPLGVYDRDTLNSFFLSNMGF